MQPTVNKGRSQLPLLSSSSSIRLAPLVISLFLVAAIVWSVRATSVLYEPREIVAMKAPERADLPVEAAASRYRAELAKIPEQEIPRESSWPRLYGLTGASVAEDQHVNLAWPIEGPLQAWSLDIGTGYGSPVVSGSHLVFNHRIGDEQIVQCLDSQTGTTLWQHRYPTSFHCRVEYSDGPYSTPVIQEGSVYSVGGLAFTRDPVMKSPCYSPPALADSRLYLRSDVRLACFDLSARGN